MLGSVYSVGLQVDEGGDPELDGAAVKLVQTWNVRSG